MATIYRFIVEQKQSGGDKGTGRGGKPRATKGAAKKGRDIPLFGGSRGGVEHNRKLRAINPLLNKVTNGIWEKGMRLGRAGMGLVKKNTETGKLSLSGPAVAIIIAFVLQTAWNLITKWNQKERRLSEKENTENYKKLENGSSAIHGSYRVMVDGWTNRVSYNENK